MGMPPASAKRPGLYGAQVYLTQLQTLSKETPDSMINLRSRLAEALILKQSPRMRKKSQAQILLEQLLSEGDTWFDYHTLILLNLCELLIFEA